MKIFITGVSEGIGRALAKRLVKNGHLVWGVARRENLLLNLQSELETGKFLFTVCDVSNKSEVERTIKMMQEKNFYPDVIVLNAVFFGSDLYPQYNHSIFTKAVGVNLFGSLIWVEQFLPYFLQRKSGSFIAISSTAAYRPNLRSVSLSSSKAALNIAFRNLQMIYFSSGINFKIINLGPVATSPVYKWLSSDNKPKYFFVLTPEEAAFCIEKVIKSRSRKVIYWFPAFITLLFRLSLILPDRLFLYMSRRLEK